MYNLLASHYDHFVNWPARLAAELPFIEQFLHRVPHADGSPAHVLDSASGTAMHAIALAQRGYKAAAADLSPEMVARARQNAAAAGVALRVEAAGFGEQAAAFGDGAFDAVICLGNSLPHVPDEAALAAALADFAACLRPGGLLLLQSRNFDAVLSHHQRWMEPQSHQEGDAESLFIRFYDFDPDGRVTFNMLTLQRQGDAPWSQQVTATRLLPLTQALLTAALEKLGYAQIQVYGSLAGGPFDAETSPNLVIAAHH